MAKKEAKQQTAALKQVAPETGKIVPKEIRLELTEQQVKDRLMRAAKLDAELSEGEETFSQEKEAWKQRQAQHKAFVKNHTDNRKKLNKEAEMGVALSTEDVLLHLNHEAGVAEYWYPAKGPSKIYETRPLEDNERQRSLIEEKVGKMADEGQEIEE